MDAVIRRRAESKVKIEALIQSGELDARQRELDTMVPDHAKGIAKGKRL